MRLNVVNLQVNCGTAYAASIIVPIFGVTFRLAPPLADAIARNIRFDGARHTLTGRLKVHPPDDVAILIVIDGICGFLGDGPKRFPGIHRKFRQFN